MTTAYIFDTETTGLVEPQVIQAASCPVTNDGVAGWAKSAFYKPTKPIELGALAAHNILASSLADCPEWDNANFLDYVQGGYMIGHNVDFDWEVVGRPPVKRICTLALARSWWPDLDSHTQSALMYHRYGDSAKPLLEDAHDAAADVRNLAKLWVQMYLPKLTQILGLHPDWEQIWQVSEECRIPKVMGFGKHKGKPVDQVDSGYIGWYLREPEPDPYYVIAFRRVLDSRPRGKR